MTITDRAVDLLRGWQRFVRATESLAIDVISISIPWAAPLIPAYMTWSSMASRLAFPWWVALAGAGVVELLGLATINTVFEFWSYNQDKRKSDSKAPVLFAILVTGFYMAVVLTVNVLMDNSPIIYKTAKGLLSSLTLCGGVTIALRAGHARRLDQIEVEKAERKAERQAARKGQASIDAVKVYPFLDSMMAGRKAKREERLNALLDVYRANPIAGPTEAGDAIGVTRQSIYAYLEALENAGRIRRNGRGVEVCS